MGESGLAEAARGNQPATAEVRTLVEVQEFSELADLGNVRFGAVILDLNGNILIVSVDFEAVNLVLI